METTGARTAQPRVEDVTRDSVYISYCLLVLAVLWSSCVLYSSFATIPDLMADGETTLSCLQLLLCVCPTVFVISLFVFINNKIKHLTLVSFLVLAKVIFMNIAK